MYSMQISESICACVITKGYIKRERKRRKNRERESLKNQACRNESLAISTFSYSLKKVAAKIYILCLSIQIFALSITRSKNNLVGLDQSMCLNSLI